MRQPCLICGTPTSRAFYPLRNTKARPQPDGTLTIEQLPAQYLCDDDVQDAIAFRFRVGWCDDPTCRRWGRVGDPSPCGAPYAIL